MPGSFGQHTHEARVWQTGLCCCSRQKTAVSPSLAMCQPLADNTWTIAGQTIGVNADTVIEDGIVVGDQVQVHGVIFTDGTWDVLEIVRLDEEPTLGCFTVSSVVVSVGNGRLQLRDWPEMILGDDVPLDDVQTNAVVNVTICVNQDGTIVVITISIIVPANLPDPAPPKT